MNGRNDTVQISLRLSKKLLNAVDMEAEDLGLERMDVVRNILAVCLRKEKDKEEVIK